MAARLAVDFNLSLEDSLALVAAVSRLPDTWSVHIREESQNLPALQITVSGPAFTTAAGVRRDAIAHDAVALIASEWERRSESQ